MICIECGESIMRDTMNEKGKVLKTKLKKFHRELLNDKIILKPKKCYSCIENKFGKIKRGLSSTVYQYVYCTTDEETKERNKKFQVTLEKQILKYGEREGTKRWEDYCEKQSITNTFEYKKNKYGMSEEEFRTFNKSRAVTLDNQILKYGEEEGIRKFTDYCKKQSISGMTEEYFIEKLGHEEGIL